MRALVLMALVACSEPAVAPDASSAKDAELEPDSGETDADDPDADEPDASQVDADAGEPPLDPVHIDLDAPAPRELSEFNFFRYRDGAFEWNDGIFPYELNTPLFSDYAAKARAIYVPPGETIQFAWNEAFEFPLGSAIIKSFLFDRIIETRLLIRHADGWRPYLYLWREDLSGADYFVRGETMAIELVDPFGNPRTAQYLIPSLNQCYECHETGDEITVVIGPKARHLNRDGQLEQLAALGLLEGLPADTSTIGRAFDFASLSTTGTTALDAATLDKATRDYLDINCAHCHNPGARQGVTSQLFLNYDNQDMFRLGLCKEPGSAGSGSGGLRYDIVPGAPRSSILWYRTQSETAGELMPLISRSLRDDLGVGLIYGWIANMPPDDCE